MANELEDLLLINSCLIFFFELKTLKILFKIKNPPFFVIIIIYNNLIEFFIIFFYPSLKKAEVAVFLSLVLL